MSESYAIELKNITKTVWQSNGQRQSMPVRKEGRDIIHSGRKWKWKDHSYEHDIRYLLSGRRTDPGKWKRGDYPFAKGLPLL